MTEAETDLSQALPEGEGKVTTIYALVNPTTGIPFYVGKANNAHKRFTKHLHEAALWSKWASGGGRNEERPPKVSNVGKCSAIDGITKDGLIPEVRILERCTLPQWAAREKFWHSELEKSGAILTNSAECGAGCTYQTQRAIEAMRSSRTGLKASPETCARISKAIRSSLRVKAGNKARKGKRKPEGFGAMVSRNWTGRKHSDETKAKISAARKGVRQPDWVKQKISAGLQSSEKARAARLASIGRKLTPEHRANVSAALKGIPKPTVSAAHKGKKKSPEHMEKLRAGYMAFLERSRAERDPASD